MTEFQLTPGTLGAYLAERGLVADPAELTVRELGGGVSNIVSLIEGPGIRWVVKQSLGKLRVKDEWRSSRDRVFREAGVIQAMGSILDGAVPGVIYVDHENFLYVMTAAPEGSVVWKKSLLDGQVRIDIAETAGRLLATMIKASLQNPAFKEKFADRTVFDELRIDPYYRTTAARHPDVREPIERLIADSWEIRTSLVHGDYSPKNILVCGDDILLIDFEVVHWGDPSFDSAFLLNHLMLKSFHQPRYTGLYFQAARAFWQTLTRVLERVSTVNFEGMTVRHLGGLMLARIDGKSPAEYIHDEDTKSRVRRTAKSILHEPSASMEATLEMVREQVAEQ